MVIISEFFDDARFVIQYRRRMMPLQKELDRLAPRPGELAPDFTLTDSSDTGTITLSEFRGRKPVALVFGSFT
jgi:hypothetical protein